MASSNGVAPGDVNMNNADASTEGVVHSSAPEPLEPAIHNAAEISRNLQGPPLPTTNAASDLELLAEEAKAEKRDKYARSASVPAAASINFKDGGHKGKTRSLQRSLTDRLTASQREGRLSSQERQAQQKKMAVFLSGVLKRSTINNYAINISLENLGQDYQDFFEEEDIHSEESEAPVSETVIPPLNICILIVGTRGDVQPFIAIGRRLQEHGHRVRLATHANFREFVTGEGLEFFPLGGDPKILAEYMVKNKGFLPSRPAEVAVQRKQLKAIINTTWAACTEPDTESNGLPFVADAIMANPPTMGHTHVAEKLRVPLHVVFTMPWTPTSKWPHPLARLPQVTGYENKLSYYVVDNMIWIGMRDIVNDFRKKKLRLPPVTYLGAPTRKKQVVPTAYIWSPSLAPKPTDWSKSVDVVGFCFLNLASNYKPPEDLVKFFDAGPAPVYIGFGSLPVQNPEKMTDVIVKALEKTKQRGIIQKGWGGLGQMKEVPSHVYLLDNCPHDWLFPRCAAVVHHGGAGTTAAGLKSACPTTVVPFFGDQPFWGDCVHDQGVGPEPIPVEKFDFEPLVSAIEYMMQPQVKEAALRMSERISAEDGVAGAVEAFHRNLPRDIRHGAHSLPWLRKKTWKHRLMCCLAPTQE